MSTAALASGVLTTGVTAPPTEVTQSPGETRRRRRIPGSTTEPLPVRACFGPDLLREAAPRPAATRRTAWSQDIEPSALQLTRRGRLLLTTVSVLIFGAAVAVLGLRVAGVLDPQPQFDHTVQVQVGAGQAGAYL